MVGVRALMTLGAATAYWVASVLPARVVPQRLLVYRWKYRPVWVRTSELGRKHGPPGESKESGRRLSKALRRSFIVDGDWDTPGRVLDEPDDPIRLASVANSMRTKGFVQPNNPWSAALEGGIQVCVGRDGALVIFNEGHHRIAASRIVGIPEVPVFIRGVHRLWLEAQLGPQDKYSAVELDSLIESLSVGRPT